MTKFPVSREVVGLPRRSIDDRQQLFGFCRALCRKSQDVIPVFCDTFILILNFDSMGWWSGDGEGAGGPNREADFTSQDEASFPSSAGGGSNLMAGGGGGAANGMQELQQASMVIQQQMLVQQVISDLSDRSYEKCVTSKPSETLTGSQVACIKSTVNKWLDTNEFMTGRLAKKSQQQQGGGFS